MRFRSRKLNKAFTLVEILIVVVILGILAAIVVPQFTNATNDAQAGNLKSQLKTLQNQIELYAARNNNAYPAFATTGWTDMINGNYVKSAPDNPAFTGTGTRSSVSVADATGSATTAWVFSTATATTAPIPNQLYASNFNEATGAISATTTD
ncbi:MAG: type II secretion system protein [Phycisphaerales bacterium]